MKIQTRQSCWETNSSSSHSLTISKLGTYAVDIPVLQNYQGKPQTIVFTGGEFGWGYDKYSDSYTKANYLATYLHVNDLWKSKEFHLFEEVIKAETGAKNIVYDLDDAYIDHQSVDVGEEAFKDKRTLKHFLFNRASILTIDNDNK